MEGEQSIKTLPDFLVEKIVAMVPFPSIFKARVLSKAWKARFSSVASLDDEEDKCIATSFQWQVRERSRNWGTFFPAYPRKRFSRAYDLGSDKWLRLPSLAFIPKDMRRGCWISFTHGALWGGHQRSRGAGFPEIIVVANIFTRRWRELPPRPNCNVELGCFNDPILVSDMSSGTYKVFGIYLEGFPASKQSYAQIYESKTDSWSSKKLPENAPCFCSPVYLNGNVYMMAGLNPCNIVAFNVEEGSLEKLRLMYCDVKDQPLEEAQIDRSVHLVVYDGQLLLIIMYDRGYLHILKIDLESLQLLEVTRGSPGTPKGKFEAKCSTQGSYGTPTSHANYIFFGQSSTQVMAYNIYKDEWRRFHFPDIFKVSNGLKRISFQPGLNLFSDV